MRGHADADTKGAEASQYALTCSVLEELDRILVDGVRHVNHFVAIALQALPPRKCHAVPTSEAAPRLDVGRARGIPLCSASDVKDVSLA